MLSVYPSLETESPSLASDDAPRLPRPRAVDAGYQPRVSVVVPVKNGAATIASCIEALLAQDYPKALTEILVVDSGSTDETQRIVSRYPVTLLAEGDVGTSYAARNCGIAHAGGEVIALTDADCTPAPDWLRHLVAPLADPTVGAALGAIDDARPESLCEEFTERVKPFARPVRSGLGTLLTGNVAIRRTTLDALGMFDERLPTGGDVDLGWRLQQRLGLSLRDAPEARVLHRHRATFRQVFAQYRRYGSSEVLLTTLYRGGGGSLTGGKQVRRLFDQARAMMSYVVALILRAGMSAIRGFDRRYVLWPLFLLTVEAGNVVGKLGALITTRYYRRNPYANPRLERSR